MPARHISNQSFDEILSDLGDDPAIPDPHGIRKPPLQNNATGRPQNPNSHSNFAQAINHLQMNNPILKISGLIALLGVVVLGIVAVFAAYDALNRSSQSAIADSQKLITELKKEIAILRDEIHQEQDDLYLALDELEVNIHSLKTKRSEIRTSQKPEITSHESELRRWRYLGTIQMGTSHQAFFNTGNGSAAFEKGGFVLGDWRLINIEKEMVTLNHPQGKSLTLKAFKSESN